MDSVFVFVGWETPVMDRLSGRLKTFSLFSLAMLVTYPNN